MSFWRRLLAGFSPPDSSRPKRLDYLNEALALERQGDYTAAITSYRLGLRDNPRDPLGQRCLRFLPALASKLQRATRTIPTNE